MADEVIAPTFTDEQWEAEVEKRLGAKPSDLIKKSEQTVVLTEAEKLELEEKQRQEVVKFGLDNKIFKTTEYDGYVADQKADKIDLLRKKYVADHPDDKEAEKHFNLIYRIDEDDDLEDGETTTPNVAKEKAKKLLEKEAEEYLTRKYSNIKGAGTQYESYRAEQQVIKENTELVAKAIAAVPKKIEIKTATDSYAYQFTDEDYSDANKMVVESGLLKKKGVNPEEITDTVAIFLRGKNFENIINEVERVAREKAIDETQRGKHGIDVKRVELPDGVQTKISAFEKKLGIT